jgi:hypothetical protein
LNREGTARIVKYVEFAEIPINKKMDKYILAPYPLESEFHPPYGYKVSPHFLNLMEAHSGDFYGEISALASLGSVPQVTALGLGSHTKSAIPFAHSLIASTKVKCLLISKIEFARMCSIEMAKISGERAATEMKSFASRELQNMYLSMMNWKHYRKKLIQRKI